MKQYGKTMACAITVALILGGCGVAQNDSTQNQTQEQVQTQDQQITLRFSWWGADVRHEATLAAIKAYEEENPNVRIEAEYQGFEGYQQKMMTQLAGGTAPDLIQIDNVWLRDLSTQKMSLFDDLNQYGDVIDLEVFDKEIIESYCSYDGKLLGIPLGTNGSGIMVNKELMEKWGISLDTQFTWDSLIEVGTAINENDNNSYLIGLDPSGESIVPLFWEPYLLGISGKYWINDNMELDVTEEEIIDAFVMLKALYDSKTAIPMGETISFAAKMEQMPKWINGEVGGIMDWSGRLPAIKGALGSDKFAAMKVPVVKDGKTQTYPTKPSLLIGLNSASKYKDEAAKFIQWMVNSEEAANILLDVRSIPASQIARDVLASSGKGDPDVLSMVNTTLERPSPAPPYTGRNAEIVAIVSEEIQKVVYSQLTPEQGAEELINRIQAKLNSLKK